MSLQRLRTAVVPTRTRAYRPPRLPLADVRMNRRGRPIGAMKLVATEQP